MVTGGGRGIGRAIALAAAEEGAGVVVADYGGAVDRNQAGTSEAADEVVATIAAAGGRAVAAAVDVSTMEGGRSAVEASDGQPSAASTAWSAALASPHSSTSGIFPSRSGTTSSTSTSKDTSAAPKQQPE